jgi:hypothetical protein
VFDNQIDDRRVTDIQHFVPGNAITAKATACCKINFSLTALVRKSHTPAGNRVSEMSAVKMPLVPNTRRKGTAENPLLHIFV